MCCTQLKGPFHKEHRSSAYFAMIDNCSDAPSVSGNQTDLLLKNTEGPHCLLKLIKNKIPLMMYTKTLMNERPDVPFGKHEATHVVGVAAPEVW